MKKEVTYLYGIGYKGLVLLLKSTNVKELLLSLLMRL
jgi:hypothetical protein